MPPNVSAPAAAWGVKIRLPMKRISGSFFLVILFLLPAAYAGPQQVGTQEAAPTIRQTVQEVVLEVVVRDGRGRVVKNLKSGELEVYEDGVRQQIRSFS